MARKHKRNDRLVDKWSLVHILNSGLLCWWLGPVPAFIIASLWEPLEIFIISPWLMKRGIVFGYETWRNSLSDIVFNTLGIVIALLMLPLR